MIPESVVQTLEMRLQNAHAPLLLAIDGRCASGKTTLAAYLAEHFAAPVFHTDDFYVPFCLRTPQRLARLGGHVDIERLIREVLEPAFAGKSLFYRAYNAHEDVWAPEQKIPPKKLYIVEGAYSLLPAAERFYGYKIFLTHDAQTQRARLLEREGEEKLHAFESRWIPAEEAYLQACDVRAQADVILDTSAWWQK